MFKSILRKDATVVIFEKDITPERITTNPESFILDEEYWFDHDRTLISDLPVMIECNTKELNHELLEIIIESWKKLTDEPVPSDLHLVMTAQLEDTNHVDRYAYAYVNSDEVGGNKLPSIKVILNNDGDNVCTIN